MGFLKEQDRTAQVKASGAASVSAEVSSSRALTIRGLENHNYESAVIEQARTLLDAYNEDVSPDNEEGGYLWRARCW